MAGACAGIWGGRRDTQGPVPRPSPGPVRVWASPEAALRVRSPRGSGLGAGVPGARGVDRRPSRVGAGSPDLELGPSACCVPARIAHRVVPGITSPLQMGKPRLRAARPLPRALQKGAAGCDRAPALSHPGPPLHSMAEGAASEKWSDGGGVAHPARGAPGIRSGSQATRGCWDSAWAPVCAVGTPGGWSGPSWCAGHRCGARPRPARGGGGLGRVELASGEHAEGGRGGEGSRGCWRKCAGVPVSVSGLVSGNPPSPPGGRTRWKIPWTPGDKSLSPSLDPTINCFWRSIDRWLQGTWALPGSPPPRPADTDGADPAPGPGSRGQRREGSAAVSLLRDPLDPGQASPRGASRAANAGGACSVRLRAEPEFSLRRAVPSAPTPEGLPGGGDACG